MEAKPAIRFGLTEMSFEKSLKKKKKTQNGTAILSSQVCGMFHSVMTRTKHSFEIQGMSQITFQGSSNPP